MLPIQKDGLKALYPHNQKAFDYMLDAIAEHKNCAISVPNDTGIKFAIVELINNLRAMKYLYLSPSVFGSFQIQSQCVKADLPMEHITFMTYEELGQLSLSKQREVLKGCSAIIMTDYLSIRHTSDAKLDHFIESVGADTSIIGITNIRPFFLDADDSLRQRHESLIGSGVELKEFFTIRDACRHGNFEYPFYYYCDLTQETRIKQFCSEIKASRAEQEYGKYQTRAKYYASSKQEHLDYLTGVMKDYGAGKYVALCKKDGASFEKDKDLLLSFVGADSIETVFYTYDGYDSSDGDIDKFAYTDIDGKRHILLTTTDSLLDCRTEEITAFFFCYRMQKPWQLYQAFNAALSGCRRRCYNPVIIDLYNNNASIVYTTPNTDERAQLSELTYLFSEMGTTDDDRKMYAKHETIPLLYYERPFEQTENLNRVIRDYAMRRVKDNDIRYFNELLDDCEKNGIQITMSNPYSRNGIDLYLWFVRLSRKGFAKYTPKDLPTDTVRAIRSRIEAMPFDNSADTLPDALANSHP